MHKNKDLKPFTCDICGKSFARKPAIHQHMLLVHMKPETQFQCELCDKQLVSKEKYSDFQVI